MDLFDNVLENIDEDYPFLLSPKLINTYGHMYYNHRDCFHMVQKENFSHLLYSGDLIKLVPSLNEKIPTLNSLLHILSELTHSQCNKNALTSIAVPQLSQTPPDELILLPVMVPKFQMETTKPSTTISIPYSLSQLEPSPMTTTDLKTEPLSLEMFNHTATDLNEKGVINLKRYNKYLYKKSK